ncbi:MAG: SprT family zinc-dependent metalloprotease [Rhodocyclaceae bacterium]|nr:SprT family zinc-dependent metalloprotease [Rhodocyclaceae bacterium]
MSGSAATTPRRGILPPQDEVTPAAAPRVVALPEQLSLFRLPPAAPATKTRHVQIGARIVAYELLTGRRRLVMTIDERGLRIGAPRLITVAAIEAFVRAHGDWVLQKLDEHSARNARRHFAIRDGATFPLLDGEGRLRVTAGANRVLWQDNLLVLAAKANADLDALARRGLQRRALDVFGERLALAAQLAGCRPPPLALSSARTRWGSCSRQSGIRLNWRLIHLPLALVDYVVAHEVAHLVEMNHSPRFWVEVERLCPGWREARRELKARAASIPLI